MLDSSPKIIWGNVLGYSKRNVLGYSKHEKEKFTTFTWGQN